MNKSALFIRPEESLTAFRKYEIVLCEIIKAHRQGKAYTIKPPTSMAPSTFVVRLRDVLRGGIKHEHPFSAPLYSTNDLASVKRDYVIRVLQDGYVYVGPVITDDTPVQVAGTTSYEANLPDITIGTREQLEKVFCLVSDRCLESCRVKLQADLRADIDLLIPIYDIAIEWQSEDTFVLV
jgi:hypothetical protein